MTEQESLLIAIRQFPDDNLPRLVYADWLDENTLVEVVCPKCRGEGKRIRPAYEDPGSIFITCPTCRGIGSVPSPERGHAELIRLQCQGIPEAEADVVNCPPSKSDAPLAMLRHLQTREQELLALHETAWRKGLVCSECGGKGRNRPPGPYPFPGVSDRCFACDGTGDAGGLLRRLDPQDDRYHARDNVYECRIEWDRGFISKVLVPRLSDVVDSVPYPAEYGERSDLGTVSTTLLLQLRTPSPYRCIQEVVPLDREPDHRRPEPGRESWGWSWIREGEEYHPSNLPLAFFRAVTSTCPSNAWPAREAAMSALGKAIVLFNASL